ncbi:MAG: hypothetical protein JWN30_2640 [Bacilli bacterium]|nr:hypothetical protein [Bacilli bacterium]
MNVSDFDFDLPDELIAQEPLEDRSASRLLVLNRKEDSIQHHHFYELPQFLHPGDCLVINNTRVLPARLYAVKEGTGARIEVLLLKQTGAAEWECLVRPGRRVPVGTRLIFGEATALDSGFAAEVVDYTEAGGRVVRFQFEGDFYQWLERLGEMPLPPYITKRLQDQERYQTVYSQVKGSAAAPTAGLHFTPGLLDRLRQEQIQIAELTLHVGLGTFRPVSVERVEEHQMHAEYYVIPEETSAVIRKTKEQGGRVIAVGTTACRTLETAARKGGGQVIASEGWTDIFLYPGQPFLAIDGLITNFHLPKSTLVMLISALAGLPLTMRAYEEAIKARYRFFSFGDAMLIL